VKGDLVDAMARRAGTSAAAFGAAAGALRGLSVVIERNGTTSSRRTASTTAARTRGEPRMAYFKASTIVVTLCFIMPS
jgi:hypothetical protein